MENASKTISVFALAVPAESSIKYERDVIVVPVVITPSRTFPDGGSIGAEGRPAKYLS
jgi:hypothetical protein